MKYHYSATGKVYNRYNSKVKRKQQNLDNMINCGVMHVSPSQVPAAVKWGITYHVVG